MLMRSVSAIGLLINNGLLIKLVIDWLLPVSCQSSLLLYQSSATAQGQN